MNVALLAEGVDRNACSYETNQNIVWSPSSRRAWIEIYAPNTIKRAAL